MKQRPRLAPPDSAAPAKSAGRWPGAFESRFFLALLLGLVWIGPAWWNHRIIYTLFAWDAAVLVAWCIDFLRLPEPAEVVISRHWTEPPSLNLDSQVELRVANHSARALQVSIADDVPGVLSAKVPKFTCAVPAQGSSQAVYTIHPTTRGDVHFGSVFLRYHGPMRFAERRATADLGQTIRVYPNLREPQRYTLYLVRSRQLEMEKRLKRTLGRGREFESLRDYRESDEMRDVSWPATARHGKLISKVYQVERSQSVFLVVDAGRLMLARTRPARDAEPSPSSTPAHAKAAAASHIESTAASEDHQQEFPSPPLTKLDYAVNAALTLAHVALHSGDSTGLITYGRKLQSYLPAARGAGHLRIIVEQLAVVTGEPLEANHALAAQSLLSRNRRRSLVVWITDLAETAATPEVIEAAMRLVRQHVVLLVVVGEPEMRGLVSRRPPTPTAMYQYAAAQEMVERREILLRRMREQGALALEFLPGRLSAGLVNQYLEIKSKGLL